MVSLPAGKISETKKGLCIVKVQSPFCISQLFVALRLIRSGAALHQKGVQPAAMAVAGDAFTAAYQTEAAFGVQGTAGGIILQHRGLQGPVAGLLGLSAQLGEKMIPESVAAEFFAHINAYLGNAPVAPAGVFLQV